MRCSSSCEIPASIVASEHVHRRECCSRHALAHEMGHVLRLSSEHTNAGLMQASWNPGTWNLASAGLLAFGPGRLGLSSGSIVRSCFPARRGV